MEVAEKWESSWQKCDGLAEFMEAQTEDFMIHMEGRPSGGVQLVFPSGLPFLCLFLTGGDFSFSFYFST